jgi:hypothetical protein
LPVVVQLGFGSLEKGVSACVDIGKEIDTMIVGKMDDQMSAGGLICGSPSQTFWGPIG